MFDNTDSLIFDLDGTLWDATQTVADAWQEALKKLDYVQEQVTQPQVQAMAGMPYDAIFEKLFPTVPLKYKEEVRETCAAEELRLLHQIGGRLYDELEPTLQYLQGKYKLYIVSNCQSGYIEEFLKFSGLGGYFGGHACYGTARLSKADNIRGVVREYDLKAPVYIGDTKGDFEASQKAGVPFVYARYGFGEVPGPVTSIDSFSELRQLF